MNKAKYVRKIIGGTEIWSVLASAPPKQQTHL